MLEAMDLAGVLVVASGVLDTVRILVVSVSLLLLVPLLLMMFNCW